MDREIGRGEWAAELKSLSDRNRGRETTIEIDHLDVGAHEQEHSYSLLGPAYDHRDDRVEIMLGEPGGGAPHLTHTIEGVLKIGVLTAADGSDQVLRIGITAVKSC